MKPPLHHRVTIIGSGPSGLTAAIYTARANLEPLLVHGPLPGGQLTTTTEVENFPGFENGIMGGELISTMQKQAERFGAKVLVDTIKTVDFAKRPFNITSENDQAITTDALIIATGANPRYLNAPGERELIGYGVSTCATCDGAFYRDQVVAVIGGGDSACEEASFLTRFARKVYLIHRRDELRASKIMADRVQNNKKIEVLWNKQVKEFCGSKEQSGLTGLTLIDSKTKTEEQLELTGAFIAIGHVPNSQLFADSLEVDDQGYLLHQPNSTTTSIPGVFVCGDVQDHVFRQAITAAGSGCMAAIEAERWLESHGE